MGRDDSKTMKTSRVASRARDDRAGGHALPVPVAADPNSADTRAILLIGMHRSGTSALARTLGLMRTYIGEPQELLPAHPQDNPTGYWERAELNAAHDRFLQSAGFSWDRVAGFDAKDFPDAAEEVLANDIDRIVTHLDALHRPWLIKDPRLCLLLPHWRKRLKSFAGVVVVRDPREIAASMFTGPRGAFTSPFVVALWEKYLRSALSALHQRRALFVDYGELLADPQSQCQRLLRGLRELGVSGLEPPSQEDLQQFLDVRLHRSVARPYVHLSAEQAKLYSWLRERCRMVSAAEVTDIPAGPGSDELLAEFERAFDYHGELGRQRAVNETTERLSAIEAALLEYARQSEHWQVQLTTQMQSAERIGREFAQLRQDHDRTLAEYAAQGQQLAEAREQAKRSRAEGDLLRARVDAVNNEHALTRNHVRNIEAQLEITHQQAALLDRHVTALQQGMTELHASWSWKLTAPMRAIARLFRWRISARAEQRLYRWYYAIPGISAARKRGLILWLHKNLPVLTQKTLSHRIYALSQESASVSASSRRSGAAAAAPRMDEQLAAALLSGMTAPPLISIVMPVYDVDPCWLRAAIDSVRRQFYPHWELCVVDDASTRADTRQALNELARSDSRIRLRRLRRNLGIAGASNAALRMVSGEYVGLLDNDDELTRDALLEMARTIVNENPDIIYSDEDKLEADGSHGEPNFKPDFNVDYFMSINYVCHFSVLRRKLLRQIGGFRPGYEGAQDYDLLLRATEHDEKVSHIPKVLYHWRKIPGSTAASAEAKPQSWVAGQRALAESLSRRQIDAVAEPGPYPNTFRVRRTIKDRPLVSILLPFRDKPELLATCVESILDKTDYTDYEVLGIDNGSVEPKTRKLMQHLQDRDPRVRFARHDTPFNFSEINNFAASQARGEHLLLLNNDTEVISPEWLRAMLEHSQRPEVGVVGARLLYPDNYVQHAGVIVGIGGVAGHAHLHEQSDRPGYFARARLPQNLSAVTFACAMTRRNVFEELGGLNANELRVAFNDIDYCLRAREAGYLIVYTPFAELYHHESRSRGYEDSPEKQARFSEEVRYMRRRHGDILRRGDPYYNPNLRLDTHDFSPLPGYVDALPI